MELKDLGENALLAKQPFTWYKERDAGGGKSVREGEK